MDLRAMLSWPPCHTVLAVRPWSTRCPGRHAMVIFHDTTGIIAAKVRCEVVYTAPSPHQTRVQFFVEDQPSIRWHVGGRAEAT